jgi:hypothetical protein
LRRDLVEGLRPSGAVDIPVELVVVGVGEVADGVELRVVDDVGDGTVNEDVAVADPQQGESAVVLLVVGERGAVLIGDAQHARLEVDVAVVVRDGTDDPVVLVDAREDRDRRLDHIEARVLVDRAGQRVIGVEGPELEVVRVARQRRKRRERRLRRSGCQTGAENEYQARDGDQKSGELRHVKTLTWMTHSSTKVPPTSVAQA